jgi:tRNA-dihydrouridine synthase
MLRDPAAVERMVRATVEAVGDAPVTAKIRAGYDDTSLLEDLARAVESGGARMLSVHCRTRLEAYREEVDWTRIARARAAVAIPVCGNGSVRTHADLERMRAETGCAFVMVGRGALADPWIFSGRRATQREAALFLVEYARLLAARNTAAHPSGARGPRTDARVKQLLRHWTAGDLVGTAGMPDRRAWLRDGDVIGRLEGLLAASMAESS